MAPIRNSSGCKVGVVGPDVGDVFVLVDVLNLSVFGDDVSSPFTDKKVAAMFTGVGIPPVELVMVIMPFKAAVTRAEKMSVLTPVVPEPLLTSASFVYVLPALSLTLTVEAIGSMAMVTNSVLPTPTVIPLSVGDDRLVTGPWFVAAVANDVALTLPSILKVATGPVKTFPGASVAVA